MKDKAKGIHDGHRKNLRTDFFENGLSGKADHQVLELLLTYAIPRRDVNPIAHKLISEFGSLAGVIDAPREELVKIEYITDNAAALIKLIPHLAQAYNKSKWGEKPQLNTAAKMIEYIKAKYLGQKNEVLYLLLLDSKCRLLAINTASIGASDHAAVSIRDITASALKTCAKYIALVHNHPSGSVLPSADDISATDKIKQALLPLDITLIDHIIISGDKTFCFSQNGLI